MATRKKQKKHQRKSKTGKVFQAGSRSGFDPSAGELSSGRAAQKFSFKATKGASKVITRRRAVGAGVAVGAVSAFLQNSRSIRSVPIRGFTAMLRSSRLLKTSVGIGAFALGGALAARNSAIFEPSTKAVQKDRLNDFKLRSAISAGAFTAGATVFTLSPSARRTAGRVLRKNFNSLRRLAL